MAPMARNDICLLATVTYRKAKTSRVTGQAASEKAPPSRTGAGYASGGAAVLPLAAVLANWSRVDYLDLDVQAPPCPWSHSPISAPPPCLALGAIPQFPPPPPALPLEPFLNYPPPPPSPNAVIL